jgi:Zn-dependent protease
MGYQDRDYSRNASGGWTPLTWLLSGSVPLFTLFGINVRAHASLLVLAVLTLVFGLGTGFESGDRVLFLTMLFAIILLHEFGHCFGARIMGGEANDILMTPLGGLASAMAPRRPLATFVTVAAGPLVNVILLAASGLAIYAMNHSPTWNPYRFTTNPVMASWGNLYWYLAWLFQINYALLAFNLLPIFPLDGGQLLQSILWRPFGYYKSMLWTLTIGMVGAALLAMWGLANHSLLTCFIAVWCFMNCYPARAQLKQAGPWAFSEEEEDYSAASWKPAPAPTRASERAAERAEARAAKEAADEAAEQRKIDRILAKVHEKGMASLNFLEKRALHLATERQRQRNLQRRR